MNVGLVLAGGGARGAYQAGVLRGIQDMTGSATCPFSVLTGISAGAINVTWLAAKAHDFQGACDSMWAAWSAISLETVFRTDPATLAGIGGTWLKDLTLGAWAGKRRISHLLDTTPLMEFLEREIDFDSLTENVRSGLLHAVGVSATHYRRGEVMTFFQSDRVIPEWKRSIRRGTRAELSVRHVLASSAIPIFFPPVRLNDGYYGDGGIRMNAPLSPAIHLGAERLLAISVRSKGGGQASGEPESSPVAPIDIAGTLFNALFFDSLDFDEERMGRINRTLSLMTKEQLASDPDQLRVVPTLVIRPSIDLGSLASEQFLQFPYTLRHLLKGLGASAERGWELLSYLAFDRVYAKTLLNLGYADALRARAEIEAFLAPRLPETSGLIL